MRVLSFGGLLIFLFSGMSLLGQSPDRHLTIDAARNLYQRSAYAHGYIHGYEDGFHNADMDIHMGRGERPLTVMKEFRSGDRGYQNEFGDKHYFRLGYKQGFREGYSDSIHNRRFRAIDSANRAASEDKNSDNSLPEKDFDHAFSSGYDAGHNYGSVSQDFDFDQASNACQAKLPRSKTLHPSSYCDAYMRGYTFGFSDGQVSRVDSQTETAKKY